MDRAELEAGRERRSEMPGRAVDEQIMPSADSGKDNRRSEEGIQA